MKRLTLYGLILSLLLCFPSLSKGDIVNFKNYQVGKSAVFTKDFYTIEKNSLVNQIKYTGQRYVSNPANIKGLWVLQAENGSTITDLSGKGHTITLRNTTLQDINASNFSPVFARLSSLTFNTTNVWNTPDHDDFSLTNGTTDLAGTWIWAGKVSDFTNNDFFNKAIAGNYEYQISTDASDILYIRLFNATGSIYIGRYKNSAWTTYENIFITVIITYDGSKASSGIKIYRNGANIDDTDYKAGSYLGMINGTALTASYFTLGAAPLKANLSFQTFIKGEALTPIQITATNKILRQRGGVY